MFLFFQTRALWKLGCGQSLPDTISLEIGELGEAIKQPESLEGRGVDAHSYAGITRLDPL